MNHVLEKIETFGEQDVTPFLLENQNQSTYPQKLLSKMADIGLFGINIPEAYGGSKIPAPLNLPINRTLSRYSLVLPALYGIHLRASQYFVGLGTEQQKQDYLPKMTAGEIIATHAYHEKAVREPEKFATNLQEKNGKMLLNGTKEWVINAHNCDTIIVIAKRIHQSNSSNSPICSAVIIRKDMQGVEVVTEHNRLGLDGVSLSQVKFNNVEIPPELIIGGLEACAHKIATQYQPMPFLNFSARATGVAESIVNLARTHLALEKRDSATLGVMHYKWSEIQMLKESIIAYFEHALAQHKAGSFSKEKAYRTKVFCSQTLSELVSKTKAICGGSGYANGDVLLLQQFRDAASLIFIDTPNDVLLSLSGKSELQTQ